MRSKQQPIRQEKREIIGMAAWSTTGNELALGVKSNKELSIQFLDYGGANDRQIM